MNACPVHQQPYVAWPRKELFATRVRRCCIRTCIVVACSDGRNSWYFGSGPGRKPDPSVRGPFDETSRVNIRGFGPAPPTPGDDALWLSTGAIAWLHHANHPAASSGAPSPELPGATESAATLPPPENKFDPKPGLLDLRRRHRGANEESRAGEMMRSNVSVNARELGLLLRSASCRSRTHIPCHVRRCPRRLPTTIDARIDRRDAPR